MEENETPHSDFVKGFNEGYLMSQYIPEITAQIEKSLGESPRSHGFLSGKEQYQYEKEVQLYPSWLIDDKSSDLEKSDYEDREKDIDDLELE